MKVRVYHSYYGCETGCCGHTVEIEDENGYAKDKFEFEHPDKEGHRAWARQFAEDVIRDRWPECLASIDWTTLEVDEVGCTY